MRTIWAEPALHTPRLGFNDFRRAFFAPAGELAPVVGQSIGAAATLGISAAAFAAEQLLKHYIGQGRKAANQWVQSGNGQDAFLKNVLKPAQDLLAEDPDKAHALVDQAWRNYLDAANEFSKKGSNQAKVVHQNLTTPAFMGTVQTLLGQDPLSDGYTNAFLGKTGNVLKQGGSTVINGLGKILTAIKAPTVKGTPPFNAGGTSGANTSTTGATPPAGVPPTPGTKPAATGGGFGQLAGEVGLGVAGSALGSLLGRVNLTDQEKQVLANDLLAQKTVMQTSQNLIGMGTDALRPALNYEQAILSGDRSRMTEALAPDIEKIGQGYRAASAASTALNPRGGPSVAFNSELPFQQQRDVSSLFQTARPQAAQQLLGAGNSLLSGGVNALMGSTGAGRDILSAQNNKRLLEADRGEKMGAGLFSTFQKYGMPALQSQWPSIFGKPQGQGVA